MASLQDNLDRLKSHLAELEPRRSSDPLANDVFEQADDLKNLAEMMLKGDTRADYPARVRQEMESLRKLDEFWSERAPEELRRYGPVFDVAQEILKVAQAIQPLKDGHLAVLRTIRENFGFLQTDYGLAATSEKPTGIRFSSGTVWLELGWGTTPDLSCYFGAEWEPQNHFWVEDLLYLYRDQRYRALPQELHLDSEEDVKNWFEFLAGVWKQYGHDFLTNRPGIFDRLAKAQAQRAEEYTQEMDRLYGTGGADQTGRKK